MKRICLLAVVWSFALATTVGAQENLPPDPELALQMGAKVICSSVYVVGRDIEYALKHDRYPITSAIDWNTVQGKADREKRTLTLSMNNGKISRTAVYNGDQGCQILPPGQNRVFFKPQNVEPRVPDPATTPWPMGDAQSTPQIPAGVDARKLAAAVDMAFADAAGTTNGFWWSTRAASLRNGMQRGMTGIPGM